jgi:sucrose phosphorylase
MAERNENFKINNIGSGVMLNAYPDSIGENLHDLISMLEMPEFQDTFSLFYVLPTFFNSDLDRGFSVIDYDLNKELVSEKDLKDLEKLEVQLKFDIVLNHLSVASPQFKDLLRKGDKSKYKDFFINWNTFWEGNGQMGVDGVLIPDEVFLKKLFMRKSGLPVLKVYFPDGSERPYWNTFYQDVSYHKINKSQLSSLPGLTKDQASLICDKVNLVIEQHQDLDSIDFEELRHFKDSILDILKRNRNYLGQMDVNANSPLVWEFYKETLEKLGSYGCKIVRLDAFAYLHKEIGRSNFFNKPGTWEYLDRIKKIAQKDDLILLPEIHAEYGLHLHDEVAEKGYYIYDFFLPGLVIHALEYGTGSAIKSWIREIVKKGFKTVNMLGCHDGIPVLDLKGIEVNGTYNRGLLKDDEIEKIMSIIIDRGGKVKNLYDSAGEKISYYQVNATFFSALGENEHKLLFARAIQMFMPGVPQVWYLDLFAGKNDYKAVDEGGSAAHKEINRTNLSLQDVRDVLNRDVVINQLKIIRLRNTSKAFQGNVAVKESSENELNIVWTNHKHTAEFKGNFITYNFEIKYSDSGINKMMRFEESKVN